MKIEETRLSLVHKLIIIVNSYCPELKAEDAKETVFFYYKNNWLSKSKRRLYIYCPEDNPSGLFGNGEWTDIKIVVLEEIYFDNAKKIGEKYEAISQKVATIVRAF
ncbi:MAG: hypothetical protein MRJ65_10560 [Candidatus Brocadiaceae bacterium]|nr:hypothetical protein [Candidatus Brocadiaceae bacterium]